MSNYWITGHKETNFNCVIIVTLEGREYPIIIEDGKIIIDEDISPGNGTSSHFAEIPTVFSLSFNFNIVHIGYRNDKIFEYINWDSEEFSSSTKDHPATLDSYVDETSKIYPHVFYNLLNGKRKEISWKYYHKQNGTLIPKTSNLFSMTRFVPIEGLVRHLGGKIVELKPEEIYRREAQYIAGEAGDNYIAFVDEEHARNNSEVPPCPKGVSCGQGSLNCKGDCGKDNTCIKNKSGSFVCTSNKKTTGDEVVPWILFLGITLVAGGGVLYWWRHGKNLSQD